MALHDRELRLTAYGRVLVSATPQAIPGGAQVYVGAFLTNAHEIDLGDAAVTPGTGWPLEAGGMMILDHVGPEALYVVGTAPDGVAYMAWS